MDFRFEIIPLEEPEMGETHRVIVHEITDEGVDTGNVLENFTTDNPYGAVEAAREAQMYSLEERFEMYAERGW